jgi:hypothetical protein
VQERGVSRQFGYVEYETAGDVEKAIAHMDGAQVCPVLSLHIVYFHAD